MFHRDKRLERRHAWIIHLSVLNDGGLETLGVGDVDGLDVGVKLLLGVLLVVTLTADADTEAEWNALDAGFPDLLVQLGVEADILGALSELLACRSENVFGLSPLTPTRHVCERHWKDSTYHSLLSEALDLLNRTGSPLFEADTVDL